ncbi:MAG: hypothetical protein ACRYGC_07750 [Janthinobacterium lividum]
MTDQNVATLASCVATGITLVMWRVATRHAEVRTEAEARLLNSGFAMLTVMLVVTVVATLGGF